MQSWIATECSSCQCEVELQFKAVLTVVLTF